MTVTKKVTNTTICIVFAELKNEAAPQNIPALCAGRVPSPHFQICSGATTHLSPQCAIQSG